MFEVKLTKKMGRGVFATEKIKKGTVVSISPVLIIPEEDSIPTFFSNVSQYVFDWKDNCLALALSSMSLLNHSNKKANIKTKQNYKNNTIKFYAKKDIRKGQQLFLDYGYSMKSSKKYSKLQKEALEPYIDELIEISNQNWKDSL